uniref:Uncharacterized protein n=1 Tax=Anguilla anguilla TaxID=7936 RepID=A0A0E9Q519_ANGAN
MCYRDYSVRLYFHSNTTKNYLKALSSEVRLIGYVGNAQYTL